MVRGIGFESFPFFVLDGLMWFFIRNEAPWGSEQFALVS